jgi:transposase InsO family protein
MKKDYVDLDQEVALFRFGLIADLVHLPPATKGLYIKLREKAGKEYVIPGSRRTTVAPETIRDWLKKYRWGGFDALLPKRRTDMGKPRKLPRKVADLLLTAKEENSDLTVPLVIKKVRESGRVPDDIRMPQSTVYKLLARNGLMRKKNEPAKDHRRFSYQYAGDLFMSDVMHGPAVKTEGNRKRKTYLIAFIDDATRVIPYAAFAYSESTAAFMPVFKQAVMRRGIPQRLFVDNGSAFRSQHLTLVCAKLGITLIHSRPYFPQGKGKIERWFRTVRLQFLPALTDKDKNSLEAINSALWAYVEMEYHRAPHRILGESPLERWARTGEHVRYPEPWVELDDLFLFETKRKVMKDRTVSLNGIVYEVDAALVGETVTLRYDPGNQGDRIEVCHKGRHVQHAQILDTYANCFVKRHRPSGTIQKVKDKAENVLKYPSLPPQPVDFSKITRNMGGKEDV